MKHKTAAEAMQDIKSGQSIFVHGVAAVPQVLIEALVEQADRLKDVEILHLHTEGDPTYAKPEYAKSFRVSNLFVGKNIRPYMNYENVDYLPCFLSEVPDLFTSGKKNIDVALIHLSPPDEHGFCTLGTSVDVVQAVLSVAKIVIAQINPQMPRVLGDGFVHISKIDHYIEVNEPIPEFRMPTLSETEEKIGHHVAELVEDGATLQMGIGTVPDAVWASLENHKNLGIHSEMWSDGALNLIEKGVVDNSKKAIHPGKTISGFLMGTRRLYDFINNNPSVVQLNIAYINSPSIIARNPKVTAINSAVEIDLTGQICADSIGPNIISGVGGQMDFMRGAALSEGGKPIIAITSRSKKGIPRIVMMLKRGAGVVTTRSHVHYVVTEYGITDLCGKTLNERAKSLIEIAHPDDRENLEKEWYRVRHEC